MSKNAFSLVNGLKRQVMFHEHFFTIIQKYTQLWCHFPYQTYNKTAIISPLYNAEIFLKTKGFFQFKIIITFLVSSFRFI